MSLHPEPFLGPRPILRQGQIQIRPPPRRVDKSPTFKLLAGGDNPERARAADALNCDLLPRIHPDALGGVPEGCIKLEPGNARGRWIHAGVKSTAIEKQPGARNANGVGQQRGVLPIEKLLEQAKRFCGDKLTTHFVAREACTLEQQDAGALAGGGNSGGGACRTAANDD